MHFSYVYLPVLFNHRVKFPAEINPVWCYKKKERLSSSTRSFWAASGLRVQLPSVRPWLRWLRLQWYSAGCRPYDPGCAGCGSSARRWWYSAGCRPVSFSGRVTAALAVGACLADRRGRPAAVGVRCRPRRAGRRHASRSPGNKPTICPDNRPRRRCCQAKQSQSSRKARLKPSCDF